MSETNFSAKDRRSILVVEDETIIAWDIALQLRDLGFEVLGPVATGEEAIELAGRLQPHLVLMDIHLGSPMDGLTAAQIIRTQFDISSVFLSAFQGTTHEERALLAKPAGYLAKPFTEEELRAAVTSALSAR